MPSVKKLGRYILNKVDERKIKQHPHAASDARSMKPLARWVQQYTDIKPKTVAEIGANYAQDAEGLRHYFNLDPKDIWVFEAHPDIYREITKTYDFNAFQVAVFNTRKERVFHIVDIGATKNTGTSSLYNHSYSKETSREITVPCIRMDDFMKEHAIESFDFLKLDVEGCNYEVLEGFGKRLSDVKVLHIESEHKPIWEGQKLYADIEKILTDNGFELVLFERHFSQSDSLWVQKEFLKNDF